MKIILKSHNNFNEDGGKYISNGLINLINLNNLDLNLSYMNKCEFLKVE